MLRFTPIGLAVLPLLGLAIARRRWALYVLIFSIPLKTLDVTIAVSHPFDLPELALLVVCGHFAIGVWNRRRVTVHRSTTVAYAFAFSVVAVISVLYLAVRPANVLVHPYNISSGFGAFELVPLSFSSVNITQLFLRWFAVGGFVILASMLSPPDVRFITRWVVVSAIVVGLFGVVYQVNILVNGGLADVLHLVGFRRFPSSPTVVGPLPRMYSVTGEPGTTASYLLYALAITATLALSSLDNNVMKRSKAVVSTAILSVLLVLTTGTTGYGGFGVFLGILVGSTALIDLLPGRRTIGVIATGACVAVVGTLSVALLSGLDIFAILAYQVGKLTLQEASGSLRIQYLRYTFELFTARPVLGLGVGSHRTTSLFGTILVETGLVGLVVFVAYHVRTFKECAMVESLPDPERPLAVALSVAGMTLFLTLLVSRSASALQLPWYWFALALPMVYTAGSVEPSRDS